MKNPLIFLFLSVPVWSYVRLSPEIVRAAAGGHRPLRRFSTGTQSHYLSLQEQTGHYNPENQAC